MSEKVDLDSEMKEQALTISRLTRDKHKLEKQIRGYKGLQARHDHQEPENNPDQPTGTNDQPEQTEKNLPEPHFVGKWQKHCPTCGDKNPEFKDETVCDPDKGGCGMHLGSKDDVEKMKACPNCGGSKAVLIDRKES